MAACPAKGLGLRTLLPSGLKQGTINLQGRQTVCDSGNTHAINLMQIKVPEHS